MADQSDVLPGRRAAPPAIRTRTRVDIASRGGKYSSRAAGFPAPGWGPPVAARWGSPAKPAALSDRMRCSAACICEG
eukprot:203156-Prorocentrum_minimum.AAC.1